jgi:hypothetical protein
MRSGFQEENTSEFHAEGGQGECDTIKTAERVATSRKLHVEHNLLIQMNFTPRFHVV